MIWKGGGGGTPPLAFGKRSKSKNNMFLKSLFRNIVVSSVFARFGFLPWKMQSLNSWVFTVFYACVL